MPTEKPFARYFIVRGHVTLWNSDAHKLGSFFQQIVITSDEFSSTQGKFQLYVLEGKSEDPQNGDPKTDGQPTLIFDEDFDGLEDANKRCRELVNTAEKQGFKALTMADILEFAEEQRQSKEAAAAQ